MAELATAPHQSALVFDDPVSSLDHKWRNKVAERLVSEAAIRQVIVFTHDMIFLNDIEKAAKRASIQCETRHISRTFSITGIVTPDLPWDAMNILARIDALEKRARGLATTRAQEDEETYKGEARHFYDALRAAWERALEEVAFAHVVMRHRDYIRDKDLVRVSALTEKDCKSWGANFGKCCGLMAGHDGSRGRNRAMPEPEELLQDVIALNTWVRELKERQNAAAEKARSQPVAVAGE
jgi:hypothetical protein